MNSRWFIRMDPRPAAEIRLFCFPYAGVGSAVYRVWPSLLPREVDVCAVQPPGRESRLREPPFEDLLELVDAVGEALTGELDRPFAFFGHSMGATVAFEVARWLAARGHREPERLFVSGRRAPRVPDPDPPLRHLGDEAFVERIRTRYGGIPDEVLKHKDLLALLLPALRSDIAALETYRYLPGPLLRCPITVFGGTSDGRARPAELAPWEAETSGDFDLELFPGNHFFLENARRPLVEAVDGRLFPGVRGAHPESTIA